VNIWIQEQRSFRDRQANIEKMNRNVLKELVRFQSEADADLEGNLLINNDCCDGMKILEGKVTLNENPGIGIIEKKKVIR
jgi:hypothetical protein